METHTDSTQVPQDLVQAALKAADDLGCRVAEVPLPRIASKLGVSRSTLIRRLGGSRAALDEAVRGAGIDPGGLPVRDRAVTAAAQLISEAGVGSTTMEAIATAANCSVESLYAVFRNRDELLAAVFAEHGPVAHLADLNTCPASRPGELSATVRALYTRLAEAITQEPRTTPALLAEALARPSSAAVIEVVRHGGPTLLATLGRWLSNEVTAGNIRPIPLPLLIHQFAAPLTAYLLVRPTAHAANVTELPDIATACDTFTDAFVRAVGTATQQTPDQTPVQPPTRHQEHP